MGDYTYSTNVVHCTRVSNVYKTEREGVEWHVYRNTYGRTVDIMTANGDNSEDAELTENDLVAMLRAIKNPKMG